jgi:hypothetical protein
MKKEKDEQTDVTSFITVELEAHHQ